MADDLYYAEPPGPKTGRIGTVWKRPVETDEGDGTTSTAMCFKVCDCNPDVPGAEAVIAYGLNNVPLLEARVAELEALIAQQPKTAAEVRAQARVAELEGALRRAEKWCRTKKGYPTTESQLVASCAKEVGVDIQDG